MAPWVGWRSSCWNVPATRWPAKVASCCCSGRPTPGPSRAVAHQPFRVSVRIGRSPGIAGAGELDGACGVARLGDGVDGGYGACLPSPRKAAGRLAAVTAACRPGGRAARAGGWVMRCRRVVGAPYPGGSVVVGRP